MSLPLRVPALCTTVPLPAKRHRSRPGSPPPPQAVLDEQTLVVRAQDGDSIAFEELVRRNYAHSYRLAYRIMGTGPDADDVLQEAFLTAWQRIGAFRGAASFSSWMYRIVVNRCSNLVRSRNQPMSVDRLTETEPAPDLYSPERRAESNAALAALRAALNRLTVGQRACWILRELDHLSYPEIAEVLKVTPTVVRGRLARARADLAEAMQEWQ